jgi:hypothetical protein
VGKAVSKRSKERQKMKNMISSATIVARKGTWPKNAGLPEVAKKARSRRAQITVEVMKVRNIARKQ